MSRTNSNTAMNPRRAGLTANQWTGFYMRATLAFNGLTNRRYINLKTVLTNCIKSMSKMSVFYKT